jgi:hypothetical protein
MQGSPPKREILLKPWAGTPVGLRAHGSARKQSFTIPAARLAAYDGVNGLFSLAGRGRSELDRSRLVRDLVHRIQVEEFQPRYRRAHFGRPVCGWPDRLRSYFWPNPRVDYTATHRLMQGWFDGAGELSRRLLDRDTWTSADGAEAAELAMQMLRWGGVARQSRFSVLSVESVFRKALGLPHAAQPPMNSGWTKVAAMATAFLEGHPSRAPHVIWDSRVSTSLVTRLEVLLLENGVRDPSHLFPHIGTVIGRGGSRPRKTRLRWAHAYMSWPSQFAGSSLVKEIRDILNRETYPAMPAPEGGTKLWTIRGVESVLFMDGY